MEFTRPNNMAKRPNRDPQGEWKAIVLSYDYIFSLPDRKCNYCLTEQEATALLQIAEYLAWQTRWIDASEGKNNDKLAAFAAGIQDKLMSGCCGDEQDYLVRYNSDGIREISYDGGETWQPDPNPDPRFIGTYYPLPPDWPTTDEKCQAASNVVQWFQQQQEATAASLTSGASITTVIASIIAIIIVVIGSTATAGTLTPILISLAAALLQTTAEAFNAAMTEEVYGRFLCNIYCHINDDGTVTQTQWQEIKNQLIEEEGGIAFRFLFDNVNALGTIGLTNMARSGAASDIDCSGCDCSPDTWCYEYDFTAEDGDWTVLYGTWTSGTGWQGTAAGSGVSIVIYKDGLTFNVTHIEVDVVCAGTCNIAVIIDDSVGIAVANDAPTGSYSWDGDYSGGKFTLNPSSGSSQGADVTMTRILFSGTGDNPFGTDNCTPE